MYKVIVLWLCFTQLSFCMESYQPEQIHLSFGDTVNDIVVTWNTVNDTQESIVEYGIDGLLLTARGSSTVFVSGGTENRTQYIHRVKLPNLTPGSKYSYHCGSSKGWSSEFWFTTPPNDPDWVPQLAVYGDLGNENGRSIPQLQDEVQRGFYDAILHIGDFAYDMDWENGRVGDDFMNKIQPIAAYVPYMTSPGNHEEAYNFSDYRNRFTMPGNTEGLWYSFNLGQVHFIAVSTEVYYFLDYGLKLLTNQYDWLEQDLKEATSPENRTVRPWVIIVGHRPMYCSNLNSDDCTNHETWTRVGVPFLHWFGMENLLYKYGVDLAIWAHEHSYERLWPLYDYEVRNGSNEEPYRNPRAPVHITTGSAGCSELHDWFSPTQPPWSAYRSLEYGFMRLRIHNSTHVYMEQVAVEKTDQIIDHIWLIREKHEPYGDE
ncbi:acid phosphatase type 7-like [Periplaneta americana]|uniref:acid phosphatase type 7-like n=1 Tax=Periplaneta americana TaxID=6978 RepID=UPI0037E77CAF